MRYINILWILVIGLFIGCGDKKESNEVSNKQVYNNINEIKITQNAVKEHKKIQDKSNSGQFYYSYNNEKNKQEVLEDEDQYTKLGAYRHIKSPYEKVQIEILASKLSKDFLIHCSACHDDYANGIIGPSLLDRDGEFIYNELIKFKQEKRKNVLMVQLVKRISDENLKALADEIANFNKKIKKLKNGQKID